MNCLAFARVGGATLNRRGQDEWVIVTNPDNLKFKDVACLNEQVYGLCDEGTLVRFELDAPLLPEVQVIASHQPDVREPRQLYLVESLGKLYMVFRYGYLIPSQRRHVTTSFLAYTFNFNALAFEEVRDLEGHAFFVGDGNSWNIPTSMIPTVTNRIYFTDDHWDWPMYLGGAYEGRDLGGFNMANRSMQSLPFSKVNILCSFVLRSNLVLFFIRTVPDGHAIKLSLVGISFHINGVYFVINRLHYVGWSIL
ncbi:hypothetical protein CMV_022385 [Castanea mollissima]|uniref:KIB1-4 beta-propeller domain-containing protein n=1 Tax=Castanea mollissima TaxID=60419 RepID=A0A8J4QWI2_9ROSI|nr:hypothetical protein CMV_022385 [Castanea mollissima]